MAYLNNGMMMSKGSVIALRHPCTYTKEGIKGILKKAIDKPCIKIIQEDDFIKATMFSLAAVEVDTFIFTFNRNGVNWSETISFIVEWIPKFYPYAKVIIITQGKPTVLLKDFLMGLNNVCAVLDDSISLKDFHCCIFNMQKKALPRMPLWPEKPTTRLTRRELDVLHYLLKGISATKVSKMMNVSYKTVSTHKLSALNKLGARSLHGLLSNKEGIKCLYGL